MFTGEKYYAKTPRGFWVVSSMWGYGGYAKRVNTYKEQTKFTCISENQLKGYLKSKFTRGREVKKYIAQYPFILEHDL